MVGGEISYESRRGILGFGFHHVIPGSSGGAVLGEKEEGYENKAREGVGKKRR